LHDFFQRQVHPVVAIDQVTVERLAVFEFDKHRVALCRRQEAEWQLFSGQHSLLIIVLASMEFEAMTLAVHTILWEPRGENAQSRLDENVLIAAVWGEKSPCDSLALCV
jgi:hypothetical protein